MQCSSALMSLTSSSSLGRAVRGQRRIGRGGIILLWLVLAYMLPSTTNAGPVEAVEAAVEEAEQHASGLHTVSWVWCLRVVFAAAMGAVTYHWVTFLLAALRRRARDATRNLLRLPPGSVWRSSDCKTSLRIDDSKSDVGVLAHSWATETGTRTESWRVLDLRQVARDAANDLVGALVCPEHGGHSGTVLIHRGGHNDLRTIIRFSDPSLDRIESVLKRVRGRIRSQRYRAV